LHKFTEKRHELGEIPQGAAIFSGSCDAGRTLSHRFGKIYKYRSGLEKKVDGNNDVVEALEMEGGQEAGGGLRVMKDD
jgi:hypothetical protein